MAPYSRGLTACKRVFMALQKGFMPPGVDRPLQRGVIVPYRRGTDVSLQGVGM